MQSNHIELLIKTGNQINAAIDEQNYDSPAINKSMRKTAENFSAALKKGIDIYCHQNKDLLRPKFTESLITLAPSKELYLKLTIVMGSKENSDEMFLEQCIARLDELFSGELERLCKELVMLEPEQSFLVLLSEEPSTEGLTLACRHQEFIQILQAVRKVNCDKNSYVDYFYMGEAHQIDIGDVSKKSPPIRVEKTEKLSGRVIGVSDKFVFEFTDNGENKKGVKIKFDSGSEELRNRLTDLYKDRLEIEIMAAPVYKYIAGVKKKYGYELISFQ